MTWNKNNPRFRRSRVKPATQKGKSSKGKKNLFSRVSSKIGGMLKSLTGQQSAPQEIKQSGTLQTHEAVDSFDDLKIARPKRRIYSNNSHSARSKLSQGDSRRGQAPLPPIDLDEDGLLDFNLNQQSSQVDLDIPEFDLPGQPQDKQGQPGLTTTTEPKNQDAPEVKPKSQEAPLKDQPKGPVLSDSSVEPNSPPLKTNKTTPVERAKSAKEDGDDESSPVANEDARLKPSRQGFKSKSLPNIAVVDNATIKSIALQPNQRQLSAEQPTRSEVSDERVVKTIRAGSQPTSRPSSSQKVNSAPPDQSRSTSRSTPPSLSKDRGSASDDQSLMVDPTAEKDSGWSKLSGPSQPGSPKKSFRLVGAIGIAVGLIAALVGGLYYFYQPKTPVAKIARIPAANLPKVAPLTPGFYELYAKEREEVIKYEKTVAQGDSLSKILDDVGIGASQGKPAIIDSLTADGGLGVVRPGAVIKSFWNDPGRNELSYLEYYPASGAAPLVVRPKGDGGFLSYSLATLPLTVSMAREGEVSSSLWEAGTKAGLDANVIMNLTEILASEVDFFTDIKTGDTFQVLFSRDYRDGRPEGTPVIDMVKLTNKGRELEYYRFTDSFGNTGYYDPYGRSSNKTFFATPLQYKRISSHYTMARKHPIFKTVRPHQGVDYAAPSGTPISSVADGTIVFMGWSGGYGRLVTIKHNDTYTTMYAHLSKFATGLKKGSTVKQGDLIGYVGATGTATGPHLDFRLKKNNVFIDPLPELAKQQGKLIESKQDLQAFSESVSKVRTRMEQLLAANKDK